MSALKKDVKKYEIFDHTSDIGVRVNAPNLQQLFVNAAVALFDIMSDLRKVRKRSRIPIKVTAADTDLLLREWLGELLFVSFQRHMLFKSFLIRRLENGTLEADAFGELINPEVHNIRTEVKAVTYYQLSIKREGKNYIAQFILDV